MTSIDDVMKLCKTLRKDLGWTQGQMAKYLGCYRVDVCDMERGQSQHKAETLGPRLVALQAQGAPTGNDPTGAPPSPMRGPQAIPSDPPPAYRPYDAPVPVAMQGPQEFYVPLSEVLTSQKRAHELAAAYFAWPHLRRALRQVNMSCAEMHAQILAFVTAGLTRRGVDFDGQGVPLSVPISTEFNLEKLRRRALRIAFDELCAARDSCSAGHDEACECQDLLMRIVLNLEFLAWKAWSVDKYDCGSATWPVVLEFNPDTNELTLPRVRPFPSDEDEWDLQRPTAIESLAHTVYKIRTPSVSLSGGS